MPKVSVIIPTYNSANSIGDAIDSVLAQTYKDYEIIVIDDGSTDNTMSLLGKYGNKIQYIFQNRKGVSVARNVGILRSNGELIAFQDADDLWLPFKLQKQVAYLEENKAHIVYSKVVIIDKNKGFVGYKPNFKEKLVYPYTIPNIATPTVLIEKTCFAQIGLFDIHVKYMEDFELFFRLTKHYKLHYMDEIVGVYQKHDFNTTSKANSINKYISKIYIENKIYQKYRTGISDKISLLHILRKDMYILGKLYFKKSEYQKAISQISKTLMFSPLVGLYFDSKNFIKLVLNLIKPYFELMIAIYCVCIMRVRGKYDLRKT